MSKNVQIRDVPDDVHAKLRVRAAEARLSLSAYLLREISDLVARPTVAEVLARAAMRGRSQMTLADAAAGVRADRESAR